MSMDCVDDGLQGKTLDVPPYSSCSDKILMMITAEK